MIRGVVAANGSPTIQIDVAGQLWTAIIDTGFTGELELPYPLRLILGPVFHQRVRTRLAAGQMLDEDIYLVDLAFDGEVLCFEAAFSPDPEILIGAGALRDYRLEVDYPAATVRLERLRPPVTPPVAP